MPIEVELSSRPAAIDVIENGVPANVQSRFGDVNAARRPRLDASLDFSAQDASPDPRAIRGLARTLLRRDKEAAGFAFAPNRARTKAVDRAVRRRFVESVDAVLAAARERGIPIAGDQTRWAQDVLASARVPPHLWACYHDLVQSALRDDAPGVARLAGELLGAGPEHFGPPGHVVTLAPHDLGANVERYVRMIDNDPENPLALEASSPAEVSRLAALMAEARDLLAEADPALLDEIDTLGHEIVLATSAGPCGFGGAASVFLWGAVVLNPALIADRVTLVEALARSALTAAGASCGRSLTSGSWGSS